MRLLVVLAVFCARLLSADEDSDEVLRHIRQKVVEAIGRSDNYICSQDLSRFYYMGDHENQTCRQPPAVPPVPMRVQDRLKLDVAVSNGSEIYSWYGAHRFSADNVGQVVRDGPISSGSFNGYLRNIFGDNGVIFYYKGREKRDGIDLYLFDYKVALEVSHYQLQAGKGFLRCAFHGSFAAKADTFDLYSLTVTANGDQIPDKTDICAAETRLVYQVVKIGDHNSLLPASYDLLLGGRNRVFTESKGIYSECHEYKGESTVHFDDVDVPAGATPTELESEPLRAGLYLQIGLRGVIDEDSTYAGLPVEATLVRDVKLKKGEMLERGAVLKGTVTRFQIFHQPAHQVKISIEFNSITDGRKIYLCNAIHDVMATFSPGFSGAGRGRRGMPNVQMSQEHDPSDGSLEFVTPHLHLDKHFTSTFVTVNHSEFAEQ